MRGRVILTALGALGIAWAALDWAQSSRADDSAKARTAAELDALRNETQRLQAALASIEQQVQRKQGSGGPTAAVPPELIAQLNELKAKVGADQAHGTLPDPAEERRQELAFADYLDGELSRLPAAGPSDPTPSLKSKLESVLGADATLLDVRCGRDLCRAKTRHNGADDYRGFQARGFRQEEQRVWSGPVSFVLLEGSGDALDQPVVAAMYFGRGDSLPSPDAAK
jgi:hypothetical protein